MSRPRTLLSLSTFLALALVSRLGGGHGARAAGDPVYDLQEPGTLGGARSFALGLNDTGQVVGYSALAGDRTAHAFLWSDGRLRDLGTLDGYAFSLAAGINDRGQAAGYADLPRADAPRAFRWAAGTGLLDLGSLGGPVPFARSSGAGIDGEGRVVGVSVTAEGRQHAFRTAPDRVIDPAADDLGTLGGGDSGATAVSRSGAEVAGWSTTSGGPVHAFRWTPGGGMQDLGTLGGSSSRSLAVSPSGAFVVGWSDTSDRGTRAFLWPAPNGPMRDLGTLGGSSAVATGVNDAGQVVGYAAVTGDRLHAFLYSEATGLLDLNSRIDLPAGWELTHASAINGSGRIVGWGLRDGVERAFLLTPRPGGKTARRPRGEEERGGGVNRILARIAGASGRIRSFIGSLTVKRSTNWNSESIEATSRPEIWPTF
jgi:probable HAF family extracellular repeat protein